MTGVIGNDHGISRQHIRALVSHVVLLVASLALMALYDPRLAIYMVTGIVLILLGITLPLCVIAACHVIWFVGKRRLQEAAQGRSEWNS